MSNQTGRKPAIGAGADGAGWTFLSNHTYVLGCIAEDPDMVLREVAHKVGITERAVQRIVRDLEQAGVLRREKVGRRNHYRIQSQVRLRHPIERHCKVGALLDLLFFGNA